MNNQDFKRFPVRFERTLNSLQLAELLKTAPALAIQLLGEKTVVTDDHAQTQLFIAAISRNTAVQDVAATFSLTAPLDNRDIGKLMNKDTDESVILATRIAGGKEAGKPVNISFAEAAELACLVLPAPAQPHIPGGEIRLYEVSHNGRAYHAKQMAITYALMHSDHPLTKKEIEAFLATEHILVANRGGIFEMPHLTESDFSKAGRKSWITRSEAQGKSAYTFEISDPDMARAVLELAMLKEPRPAAQAETPEA